MHTVHVLLSVTLLLFMLGDDDDSVGVFLFLTPQSSHFSDDALLEKKQIEQAHTLLPLLTEVVSWPAFDVTLSFADVDVVSILMIIFGDDLRNPPYIENE